MAVVNETPAKKIPPSRQAPCHFCGSIIDTAAAGNFQRVTGWAKIRHAGGLNNVWLPERSLSWACRGCIDRLSAGVSIDQGALFDE